MVAHTLRFAPILDAARRRLPEIGPLHRVRVAQRLEPSPLAWQRDPAVAGGGSITLTGIHLFDLLRWFVGRTPDAVQCRLLRLGGHPLENCFDACFEFEAEAILAATEVSKFASLRDCKLELIGETGALWVDYRSGSLHLQRDRRLRLLEESGDVPTLPETLRAFLRFARGERANPVPAEVGFAALEMAAACYDAHAQGRRVRIASSLEAT
jgi:predicted dehydrogenase